MKVGNFDIRALLQVLYDAMEGISPNRFTSNRPTNTDAMNDFIVVEFRARLFNKGGYGMTTCRISLYARDNASTENLPKLSAMQEAVYERLPISSPICTIAEPVPLNAGSDGLGFHCWHIQCSVIIKHKI